MELLAILWTVLVVAQGVVKDQPQVEPVAIELNWESGRPERVLTEEDEAVLASGGVVDGGPVFYAIWMDGELWWTNGDGVEVKGKP